MRVLLRCGATIVAASTPRTRPSAGSRRRSAKKLRSTAAAGGNGGVRGVVRYSPDDQRKGALPLPSIFTYSAVGACGKIPGVAQNRPREREPAETRLAICVSVPDHLAR